MRFLLVTLLWATLALGQESFQVHSAVFSSEQTFWPGLPPQAAPAARKAGASKSKPAKAEAHRAGKGTPLSLAVLPIRIAEKDWQESIPCDSCHRLSANGMEFFLENYLAERLRKRFPKQTVELIAPHSPFLVSAKINLLAYQDSLAMPWDKWFDGYTQSLIYRPRDRMTPASTVRRMDRLGGLLGATHLLLPAKVWVKLEPKSSHTHSGNMEWGFHLVFWNVGQGRAEWAMALSEKVHNTDLDAALDGRLDKALLAAWDSMPAELAALWKTEPH